MGGVIGVGHLILPGYVLPIHHRVPLNTQSALTLGREKNLSIFVNLLSASHTQEAV